ncbi:ATP-binding protein [Candidatus Saccharibacteria bacterium]|nr:ATP-binding protein [Candidatus Saccharibacteria bacterium]
MNTQPKLVIVRGVPGSGKSYIATMLAVELGRDMVCMLDPDTVDLDGDVKYLQLASQLASEGVDEKFHLYRYLRAQAYEAIEQGKILLWNQPFIDLKGFEITVNRLKDYAAEHGRELPVLVVEVQVPENTARARVKRRKQEGGHGPADEVLERFLREYRSFADNGYDTCLVDGEGDVTASVVQVVTRIDQLNS